MIENCIEGICIGIVFLVANVIIMIDYPIGGLIMLVPVIGFFYILIKDLLIELGVGDPRKNKKEGEE